MPTERTIYASDFYSQNPQHFQSRSTHLVAFIQGLASCINLPLFSSQQHTEIVSLKLLQSLQYLILDNTIIMWYQMYAVFILKTPWYLVPIPTTCFWSRWLELFGLWCFLPLHQHFGNDVTWKRRVEAMLYPCLDPLCSTDLAGMDPRKLGLHKDTLAMQTHNKKYFHVTTLPNW